MKSKSNNATMSLAALGVLAVFFIAVVMLSDGLDPHTSPGAADLLFVGGGILLLVLTALLKNLR